MKKEEIVEIVGQGKQIGFNSTGTAYEIDISGDEIDLFITIPFDIHEIFYEARDKQGTLLLKDWRDHYGDNALDDFKKSLVEIARIIKSPIFRVTNGGKTLEAKDKDWFYLFGYFTNQ